VVYTIVDISFAVRSREAENTLADVAVDPVHTCCAVQTRVGRALVDIRFAVRSREAEHTLADVAVDPVHTSSTVLTGV
jgi:hypothetical protein